MDRVFSRSTGASPWRVFLATACVLLVVLMGAVQVAHVHADGRNLHPECSLCATAHVVVQVVHAPVPLSATAVAVYLEPRPQERAAARPPLFALFTRPPPAR